MQRIAAILFSTVLLVNTAYAAGLDTLAPGKPAGVGQAQTAELKTVAVITLGTLVVVGFGLLTAHGANPASNVIPGGAAGNGFTSSSVTTTTTTP